MTVLSRHFMSATEVTTFINTPANSVVTIVAIVYDAASARYVLFYKKT